MFWNKDRIPNLKLEDDDQDFFRMDEDLEEKEIKEEKQETEKFDEKINFKGINTPRTNQIKIINRILNVIMVILIITTILVITDIMLISRIGKGPYFALNTKTYHDGGTKVYYGIGYKVIKYNQEEGRKDTVIGNWNIEYNTTPIKMTTLDLALEFSNDLEGSLDIYMDNYLQVSGKIEKIEKSKVTLIYQDEEKKYKTKLTCNILNPTKKYHKDDSIKLVGTLYNYSKEDKLKLYMKNCYIKK